MTDGTSRKSLFERFLSLFTDVRRGEGMLVLLMAFDVFLLLTSYYLIKPVREALILAEGGAEAKSYLVAAMAILLFFLVGGYAKLVSRYERTRLITVVTSLFIACLIIFWALSRTGLPYLGYAFFIWVGIFSVMVVAQFWSYANDVYNNEAGKRLFPLVAFGGSFGAFAGATGGEGEPRVRFAAQASVLGLHRALDPVAEPGQHDRRVHPRQVG